MLNQQGSNQYEKGLIELCPSKRRRRRISLLLLFEEEDANGTERLNTTQKKIVIKSQAPGRPGDFTSASLTTQTFPSLCGAIQLRRIKPSELIAYFVLMRLISAAQHKQTNRRRRPLIINAKREDGREEKRGRRRVSMVATRRPEYRIRPHRIASDIIASDWLGSDRIGWMTCRVHDSQAAVFEWRTREIMRERKREKRKKRRHNVRDGARKWNGTEMSPLLFSLPHALQHVRVCVL